MSMMPASKNRDNDKYFSHLMNSLLSSTNSSRVNISSSYSQSNQKFYKTQYGNLNSSQDKKEVPKLSERHIRNKRLTQIYTPAQVETRRLNQT